MMMMMGGLAALPLGYLDDLTLGIFVSAAVGPDAAL